MPSRPATARMVTASAPSAARISSPAATMPSTLSRRLAGSLATQGPRGEAMERPYLTRTRFVIRTVFVRYEQRSTRISVMTDLETTDSSVPKPYRWRWAVLAVILGAEIMDLLDSTIVNLAATPIAKDLGGGASTVQWVVGAYTLAFAVALVIGGRLGDKYGRKNLFVLGAAGFTLASLVCAHGAGSDHADRRSGAQGLARCGPDPAGFRHHEAGLRTGRPGQGVRQLRPRDRAVRDRRTAARRRPGRREPVRARLAGHLHHQRADRDRDCDRSRPAHPTPATGAATSGSTRSAWPCSPARPCC